MRFATVRSAEAAFLTIALCALPCVPLGAQSAGLLQPSRDTLAIRIMAPNRAQLDTLHTLMQQLEQLPPDSPARDMLLRRIDGLMPPMAGQTRIMFRGTGGIAAMQPKGWVGMNVEGPRHEWITNDEYSLEYFDHPKVTSVDPDSPAARAGVARGDVLMAYNGIDVVGHRFDLLNLLVPDRKLAVTVQREGDVKEYELTVVRAPERIMLRRVGDVQFDALMNHDETPQRTAISTMRRLPVAATVLMMSKGVLITPNGAFGAVMSTVSQDLARTLKLEPGVLVNDITDDTPASRSGLHTGDVIVNVSGEAVASLKALQEVVLRQSQPSVALQVVRDHKTRTVTVRW